MKKFIVIALSLCAFMAQAEESLLDSVKTDIQEQVKCDIHHSIQTATAEMHLQTLEDIKESFRNSLNREEGIDQKKSHTAKLFSMAY